MKQNQNSRNFYRRLFVGIIVIISITIFGIIFPLISDLIVVLILTGVLNYVYRPGVDLLTRYGIKRNLAIMILYAITGGLIYLITLFLFPILSREAGSFMKSLNQVDFGDLYRQSISWLDNQIPGIAKIFKFDPGQIDVIVERITSATTNFLQKSWSFVEDVANILSLAIILPILTFFLLKDGHRVQKNWMRKIPNRYFEMTLSLVNRIDVQLGNYLRSILIESLIMWLVTWPLFLIMGVRFSLILALINGLLNMIPFFGPLVTYVPLSLVVIISYEPIGWGLFWGAVILIITQIIDNAFLKPVLISRNVPVHPAMVLIAVMVGGRLAGPIGMFVAVPFYAVIQVIVIDFYDHLKSYKIL